MSTSSATAKIDEPEIAAQAMLAGAVPDSTVGGNGATAAQVLQALGASGSGLNGSGIKVGVLSDSFNDLGGAAADEADGALPSAANVQVLEDAASGGADEGRAMMQIVHDIAPAASLAFYTAFNSEQDFANGILALAAAGCKVICDDVSYLDEPFFQNGIIAKAIETVEAEGVVYVTAAGNDASNAYQAAWTPTVGIYDGTILLDAQNFGGSSLVQTLTVGGSSTDTVPLILEWDQPFGQATSDLEILAFKNGHLVATATNASSGEKHNPWVELDLAAGTYQIAIDNLSGPDPSLIKEITEGDGLPITLGGANAGTVFGHAMTPGAISAGAVSTAQTPAFGFNPALAESFSSSGAGTELLFDDQGHRLSTPDAFSPVAVSSVDDIHTTVPGELSDFYGTSAASASLAGVAALILSANPNLTPNEVELILEDSALPMANSAVSGAGLVQVGPAAAYAVTLFVPADDVTGDGTSDILFLNSATGDIGYYAMSNGTLQGWHGIGGSSTAYSVVGIGDFNGDRSDDILFRNNATGDTGFYEIVNGVLQGWHGIGGSSTAYSVVGIGDFYGNGTDDILFRNNATGDTGFYQMSGGAFVGWHEIGGSSTAYSVVGVGDFSGNGTDDILFRNNATGDMGYYQMVNGAFVGWHEIGGSSTAYSVAGIGDFYGNGTDDILFRNNATGDTGFYQMSDGAFVGWREIGGSSTAYSVAAVGDYTGNGTDDILFRDNANGATGYYQMSNGAMTGWHGVAGSSTAYHVVA